MVPELVYLLTRLGNNKEALLLIINRMQNVQLAIEFASSQNDTRLWEEFLQYSCDKPAFIIGLLEAGATGSVNPLRVIERIPPNLEIPGLIPALIKVMRDCTAHVILDKVVTHYRFLSGKVTSGYFRGISGTDCLN